MSQKQGSVQKRRRKARELGGKRERDIYIRTSIVYTVYIYVCMCVCVQHIRYTYVSLHVYLYAYKTSSLQSRRGGRRWSNSREKGFTIQQSRDEGRK